MTDPADAWRAFCEALATTGERILADDFPADAHGRAEGRRHLARLTVMALQSHLEYGDVDFPAFHRYDDDVVKWGGPNVDNQYLRARIDPTGTYRIVGYVSGVRELIVSTHEGDMQLEQYGVFAERRLDELTVRVDGTLDLVVGGAEPEPARRADLDWIPLDPAARIVMIRVYVSDWQHDALPWFDIERIDRGAALPPPLDPGGVADGLGRAAEWVDRSVVYWRDYLERGPVRRIVNSLTAPRGAAGGSSRILYGAGWWELVPGEVLAIEFTPPACDYWSIQLYSTPWFESLDVRNRLNSYNAATAAVDADGVVRLVVGERDPSLANWLDTECRPTGMISYRFVGAADAPTPVAAVVAHDELPAHWPGSVVVDAARRAEQIAARRRGIARRFHT